MDTLVRRPFGKRFLLALLLVGTLAFLFWTQSRYPSLDEKAMMSGAIQLEDPISFEAAFRVLPEYPVWKKIGYTTLNWIKTNKQGMTFGVLFAAAFLTLLGYLRRHSLRNGFSNSALGLVMGAPLGVCVNCAAPIAKGLYSGGARAETTLSAMIASPTLNIVVVTMLFSLLPFYMAVTKIVLSLLVILVAVPVICRYLPRSQLQIANLAETGCAVPTLPGGGKAGEVEISAEALAGQESEGVVRAVVQFVRDFALNLWFVIRTTVPLMMLAGFLGAVIATLVPASLLENAGFGIVGLVAASLVGVFMPVPIGFDVVTTGAMLNAGLDPGYVMALLFTLGIFSIYSFFIVAGAISLRAGLLLGAVIAVLGIGAGYGVHTYHSWQNKRALEILTGFETSLIGSAHAATLTEAGGVQPVRRVSSGDTVVEIAGTPFAPKSHAGDTPFTRLDAWNIGLDKPVEFSFADMWPPFWEGRSIAAADFDRDGDPDIVMASTERGLYFYTNDGSGHFTALNRDLGRIATLSVFNAAFVDADNDGWPDLFLATYGEGNFLVPNRAGVFDFAAMTSVANRDDAVLTMALSFADVDGDGDLDAALGNWAAGWYRRVPGEEARNRIVLNDGGRLDGSKYVELPGLPGETLSILLSDINADRAPDLLVANDFEQPDIFYIGDGKGGFTPITRADDKIPMTTTTTMAVKTADLDNDGGLQIYLAQIAGRSGGAAKRLKMQPLARYCDEIERNEDRATCERNMAIKSWYKSGHRFDPASAGRCAEMDEAVRDQCKAMMVKDLAIQNRDPSICRLIAKGQERARALCEIHFRKIRQPTRAELDASIPQILGRNVLLSRTANGAYREEAQAVGLDVGGWSWDVKIGDVDNDGWQDMYIVNGTWVPNEVSPSNLFYHRRGGDGFAEASAEFGLEDYLMTAAALALDIDMDGDLDFITVPVNGPPRAFLNNASDGNAIVFELEDHVGNRDGIGARVVVHYGAADEKARSEGRTDLVQTREIQLGGGFMSFDAPVAHFGLGSATEVASVTIEWAGGGRTEISGGLAAGNRYRIRRLATGDGPQ